MKVCHITTVHPPLDARIFYRMCRGLAAKNVATVLIAPGGFNAEACLQPSCANGALAAAPRLQRIGIALKAALTEDADVYHFHDPELIPMAHLLKRLRPRRALVYDVHEDYPSMMREKYWLPRWTRPAAAWSARLANRTAERWLDGIVAADAGVAGDFSAAKKTLIHYNFPVLKLFPPHDRPAPAADLVYLGGLSERAGVFVLFEALKLLGQSGVRPTVRLAGYTDGARGMTAITAALSRSGLDAQVELHGRLAHGAVPAWLRSGRIGLVTLQAVPKFMKNIPSKMFEYWACGLPVVASDLPPIRQFLVEGQSGYFFPPASAPRLAERIAALLSRPDHARALGQAGRRQVELRWNNENQMEDLVRFYEALAERARKAAPRRRVPPGQMCAPKERPSNLPERSERSPEEPYC
jgi:glycosyltransferase involved in cell wall biosynthesis